MCTDIGAINVTSNLALQFDCTSEHGGEYKLFMWFFSKKVANFEMIFPGGFHCNTQAMKLFSVVCGVTF